MSIKLFGKVAAKHPDGDDPFAYIGTAAPQEHEPGGFDDQPDRRDNPPHDPDSWSGQWPPTEQPKGIPAIVLVPVKGKPPVVRTDDLSSDQWTTFQRHDLNANPLNVVGAHPRRTGLVVKNIGATPVFLGPNDGVSTAMGHQLDTGESVTFTHTGAVFAVTDGTAGALSWFAEYLTERQP